jgi:hypothetical protein
MVMSVKPGDDFSASPLSSPVPHEPRSLPETMAHNLTRDEPDGAVLHGRLLRHMAGTSVGGWGGRVNPHIMGLMLAATTRSASWCTDVKDVGSWPNGIKLNSKVLPYQCFAGLSAWLESSQASLGSRVTAWGFDSFRSSCQKASQGTNPSNYR